MQSHYETWLAGHARDCSGDAGGHLGSGQLQHVHLLGDVRSQLPSGRPLRRRQRARHLPGAQLCLFKCAWHNNVRHVSVCRVAESKPDHKVRLVVVGYAVVGYAANSFAAMKLYLCGKARTATMRLGLTLLGFQAF